MSYMTNVLWDTCWEDGIPWTVRHATKYILRVGKNDLVSELGTMEHYSLPKGPRRKEQQKPQDLPPVLLILLAHTFLWFRLHDPISLGQKVQLLFHKHCSSSSVNGRPNSLHNVGTCLNFGGPWTNHISGKAATMLSARWVLSLEEENGREWPQA